MQKLSLAAALFVLSLAGCGSSSSGTNTTTDPVAGCNEGADVICQKLFTCAEASSFRSFFGANQAECATGIKSDCSSTPCETGQTYHADKAGACLAAIKGLTCASLTDPASIAPASCDEVCTGP